MVRIRIIPAKEFQRVRAARMDQWARLSLLADMCRANTLATVKRAGSGHLGTSFSSLDIVTLLYFSEMNTASVGIRDPNRDIYFSSKGHDAPGLYAVLHALGILPKEQFIRLRRLGGTYGHPDVSTPGVEANTGSLGMGIAKGKGMAFAKRQRGYGGRVFVMTGDGELQEGQIFESLQTAAHQKTGNLIVIVDHNKVQSDKRVSEIIDLGDLVAKFSAFGWETARCDGHDFAQLDRQLRRFRGITDKPKVLIADTLKGRGVSFMEHPAALEAANGIYRWHAGAPDDASFQSAWDEITASLNERWAAAGEAPLEFEDLPTEEKKSESAVSQEYVAEAYGKALVALGQRRSDLIVLDGDLAADCRIREFENVRPEQFVEEGIAEQDMVSMAGGLALQGFLPVVNSFAAFLAARANEQIYNNACERTRIIYVSHYAGLIPAGPGQSHQSIRDISLFAALPNFTIVQPCNALETQMALEYCVNESQENCVLRLIIGPSPEIIRLPTGYRMEVGRGVALTEGEDTVLFAYGPVMLHEGLQAAELLARQGLGVKVVNLPWLNRIDRKWLAGTVHGCRAVCVLEDHSPVGGLGDRLLEVLAGENLLPGIRFKKFGVEGYPACGTPQEVLQFHGLDSASLANRILAMVAESRSQAR